MTLRTRAGPLARRGSHGIAVAVAVPTVAVLPVPTGARAGARCYTAEPLTSNFEEVHRHVDQ